MMRNGGGVRKYSAWGAESIRSRCERSTPHSGAKHICGAAITVRGAGLIVPRSTDSTERLLLELGAITLLIVVTWYAVTYAMELLRINGSSDAFILAALVIPGAGPTALLLLVGWGIQRYQRQPFALFAGFVVLVLVGWATALAGEIWVFFGFRFGGAPPISSLFTFFAIAGIAHLVALFLLLLLALLRRPSGPIPQSASAPPVDPTL